MGKKRSYEGVVGTKAKQSGKEKLSVYAMLTSMDPNLGTPKKGFNTSSKPKAKTAPKASSYFDGIDLPSSDEEDDMLNSREEQKSNKAKKQPSRHIRNTAKPLDTTLSDKELKKREKKAIIASQAVEHAKKKALRDDRDAFTIVIGSRASVIDGKEDVDADVKDMAIENFFVSARRKNASVKISHGTRYGLVGPSGIGKSTLLKLLAWRKMHVPKNIDVLLVKQEMVGDDRSAFEAVVPTNEELIKLQQEVASLQGATMPTGEDGEEDEDDENNMGEKLSELY